MFINKGYTRDYIEKQIKQVQKVDRHSLPKEKEQKESEKDKYFSLAIILDYNTQYKN